MNTVLALDTALGHCSVGLLKETEMFLESEPMHRNHAEVLHPKILGLLEQARIDFKGIRLIAVTVGPGSFTGLRAGIAAAKGLSLAAQIPLVGYKTFEAVANLLPKSEQGHFNLLVAINALRSDTYCQLYDSRRHEIKPAGTFLPDEILYYTGLDPLIVIGNGSPAFKDVLTRHHPHVIFRDVDYNLVPRALCQESLNLLPRAYTDGDLSRCQPYYLRPPDVTLPQ